MKNVDSGVAEEAFTVAGKLAPPLSFKVVDLMDRSRFGEEFSERRSGAVARPPS